MLKILQKIAMQLGIFNQPFTLHFSARTTYIPLAMRSDICSFSSQYSLLEISKSTFLDQEQKYSRSTSNVRRTSSRSWPNSKPTSLPFARTTSRSNQLNNNNKKNNITVAPKTHIFLHIPFHLLLSSSPNSFVRVPKQCISMSSFGHRPVPSTGNFSLITHHFITFERARITKE